VTFTVLSNEITRLILMTESVDALRASQSRNITASHAKSTLNATVVDEDFLAKVNKNEVSFSKGDLLICDVRVVTQNIGGQLKAEYFIERVLEHRHIEPHPELFVDEA
jgi:hypothetical protein